MSERETRRTTTDGATRRPARPTEPRGSARAPDPPEPFDYAAQWEDEGTEELTLPTGKRVLVRHPDVIDLARQGLIPNHLTPIVEEFIFDRQRRFEQAQQALKKPGERIKGLVEFYQFADVVAVAACVEPRFTLAAEASDGALPIKRLRDVEKLAIWQWSEGLAAGMATFPAGADGADGELPAVDGGAGPEPAPEPADRPDDAA